MRDIKSRIFFYIIIISVIAVGLVFLAHDFFKETDARENTKLVESTASETPASGTALANERVYYVIYQENSSVCQKISAAYTDVLDVIKVHYQLIAIEDAGGVNIQEKDDVILIVEKWRDYEAAIDQVLNAGKNGASIILGFAPGNDTLFQTKMNSFGITDIGQSRLCTSLAVKEDMLLGLHAGDVLTHAVTEDSIYEFELTDACEVYLTDENDVPLYYTVKFGKGRLGVYNGQNTAERYYGGVIIGILGTMADGIAYPIINAGVMFIDDWPGPLHGEDATISEQYGMDMDGFLRYIWWPDMLTLNSKYGVVYTSQYMLTYNDVEQPPFDLDKAELDIPMYTFGQQVMKYDGEVGLHGYNHQPLWFEDYLTDDYNTYYTPWASKEDAAAALTYAVEQWHKVFPNYRLNSYVPPSNIIDETGIEVVKEVLGTPVIISGLYLGEPPQVPEFDFTIEDGVIYFPRLTAGSFMDDETKLQLELGAGLFGVVSHFVHPDDVLDPERNNGATWTQLADQYDNMMGYVTERYPFIEFMTVSEAADSMTVWYSLDYSVVYGENGITVTTENYSKPYDMILLSDRPISLEDSGSAVQQIGTNQYYIQVKSAKETFRYSEGN